MGWNVLEYSEVHYGGIVYTYFTGCGEGRFHGFVICFHVLGIDAENFDSAFGDGDYASIGLRLQFFVINLNDESFVSGHNLAVTRLHDLELNGALTGFFCCRCSSSSSWTLPPYPSRPFERDVQFGAGVAPDASRTFGKYRRRGLFDRHGQSQGRL